MKKLLLPVIIATLLISSCSITSTATVDPDKTFVLGEGKHRRFAVDVENVGNVDIAVDAITLRGTIMQMPVLAPGEKRKITVPKNTRVTFENLGNEQATVQLKVTGDTRLSMGYE